MKTFKLNLFYKYYLLKIIKLMKIVKKRYLVKFELCFFPKRIKFNIIYHSSIMIDSTSKIVRHTS